MADTLPKNLSNEFADGWAVPLLMGCPKSKATGPLGIGSQHSSVPHAYRLKLWAEEGDKDWRREIHDTKGV